MTDGPGNFRAALHHLFRRVRWQGKAEQRHHAMEIYGSGHPCFRPGYSAGRFLFDDGDGEPVNVVCFTDAEEGYWLLQSYVALRLGGTL